MKTPLIIITGYLGAGKTTLIKNILNKPDRKIAVLMNEFGEIAIDTIILKGKNVDMVELAGGCVCCSMTGEFEAAVREIMATKNPEVIIVETTGVAEPDALLSDISESLPEIHLDSVVTVVDADGLIRFPSIGHTAKVQIEIADILLVNKIDLISAKQRKELETLLRELNKRALIIPTERSRISLDILFSPKRISPPKAKGKKHEISADHAIVDQFFIPLSFQIPHKNIESLFKSLPPQIYRIKGFIETDQGYYLIQGVGGHFEYERMEEKPEALGIVCIGSGIISLKEQIEQMVKSAKTS